MHDNNTGSPLRNLRKPQIILVVDELYTFLLDGAFHPWIGQRLELHLPLSVVYRVKFSDDVARVARDFGDPSFRRLEERD